MKGVIGNLAQLMRAMKQENRKPVLMLGAGASLSSDIPPTLKIMEELLEKYAQDLTGGTVEERFGQLWRRSPPQHRKTFLKPYLNRQPSSGYLKLAELIKKGYFDVIITFNFDKLLEDALHQVGFSDFKTIIRDEAQDEKIEYLIDAAEPRVKLLKLHGDLYSTDAFLFSEAEMANYPDQIARVVKDLTRRDIVVCGYACNDDCVMKAFYSGDHGEAVFCVNPAGVPSRLRGIMIARRSLERVVKGPLGKFDPFIEELSRQLTAPAPPVEANPFKFLASHEVQDKDLFFGRKKELRSAAEKLGQDTSVLYVVGKPRAGKTSFVRAGLLARLDPKAYRWHYLRCNGQLSEQLCELALKSGSSRFPPQEVSVALSALVSPPPSKHTVLVLDQFERVIRKYPDAENEELKQLFGQLCKQKNQGLTVVLVTSECTEFYKLLVGIDDVAVDFPKANISLKPFTKRRIAAIIRLLCRRGKISFDREVWRDIADNYDSPGADFSLAHVQTICYLLTLKSCTSWEGYQRFMGQRLVPAISAAINDCNIINFVEDLPLSEERALIRSLMEIVSNESRTKIAGFIKNNFAQLLGAANSMGRG